MGRNEEGHALGLFTEVRQEVYLRSPALGTVRLSLGEAKRARSTRSGQQWSMEEVQRWA